MSQFSLPDLLAAVSVALPLFAIGVASPGPATLAIMNISMRSGRAQGLAFGLGVCSGSLFWGTLAALGLAAVLAANVKLMMALKVSGGLYFLWLAFKLLRAAWQGARITATNTPTSSAPVAHTQSEHVQTYKHCIRQYFSGVALHLLNPKAMFVWMAVIAIGLTKMQNPNPQTAIGVTLVCWSLSVAVFVSYALLFSTETAIAVYRNLARWIDGFCGVAFVIAGVVILFTV